MAGTMSPPARLWLHRGWRALRFLVVAYLAIIMVFTFLENWLIFRPAKARDDWWPPDSRLKVQDIDLKANDGRRIHAWWCPRAGSTGAVLYCHGNAGNLSWRQAALEDWLERFGESVLIFDYPGFGRSEGSPDEVGCYAAGAAAFAWLTEKQGIQAEQIILYGKSLGGGVAVELATRHPHRALVLVKTFTSLPEMAQQVYPWLPGRWLARTQFNNLGKLPQCNRPVFVAHGDCDGLIPFAMAEQLYEAAPASKRFLPLPGCTHNDGLPLEFYTALKQFLAEVESPKPTN